MKRATANRDYGFVRKPELRHQYGMLFNHHGQVISGLRNMDLFLSIDLPKVEDIAHVPPPFPECDNWAAPHKSNRNQHVYILLLFGIRNRQTRPYDRTQPQHESIPRGSSPHHSM